MFKEIENSNIMTRLMRAVILEDYNEADAILSDENFDPNLKTKTWGAPVLTALITVLSGVDKIQNTTALKSLFKRIAQHPKFDPNVKDDGGETVLMHIARSGLYNWLVPFIMLNKKVDLTVQNFMHLDVMQIANRAKNTTMLDVLLTHKRMNHRGLPKKIVGLPKKVKTIENTVFLNRVDVAYSSLAKVDQFSMYHVLKNFLEGKYDEAYKIVMDEKFDPNETNRWDEPALTNLIYISQDKACQYDEEQFRKIATAIVNREEFDVNYQDAEFNTPLMVSITFKKLHWLTELMYEKPEARCDLTNDCGLTLLGVAIQANERDFYNHLVENTIKKVTVPHNA